MGVSNKPKAARPKPIAMPKHADSTSLKTPKTPKTPQDDAISFFSGAGDGEPVQVWELTLEDDGGPSEAKSVNSEADSADDSISDCLRLARPTSSGFPSCPDLNAR